ncbi:MAG: FAD-dependent oxidoreductase [Phycisphaerae bacterium]|nr:FAD-dependent oxidoreductase [Phycisphaerae bacterium]
MTLLLRNLTLSLDDDDSMLRDRAARRLRIAPDAIREFVIVRRSIDARRKDRIQFVYNVELALAGGPRDESRVLKRLHRTDVAPVHTAIPRPLQHGRDPIADRPIVVGFGPAGMFAALWLARHGYRPIVIDRGQPVKTRHRDILQRFYRLHEFDPESNLLYGEGGAGAYSDGKLYTRVNDPHMRDILQVFVDHGAPHDILVDSRPHLGSDRIPTLCARIRATIIAHGGEVRFGTRLDRIEIVDGAIKSIRLSCTTPGASPPETLRPGALLLGLGHSARDTIRMLVACGVQVVAKPFQLGVRVEHPQSLVNRWQYGPSCGHHRLPPAEYHLVAKGAAAELGDVYSFCMCPGGLILPTNESPGLIATNGASGVRRNQPFANSGIVMTVPIQAIQNDPIRGLEFVEHWERTAFELTGRSYRVPCQRAADFVAGRKSEGRPPETSYPLGGAWTSMNEILPNDVVQSVRRALADLDARLPGFAGDEGLVTGPESRASAPVRIPRNPDTRESVSTQGLFPIGEGAGYAGGIMSAAADGVATAETLIRRFAPPI